MTNKKSTTNLPVDLPNAPAISSPSNAPVELLNSPTNSIIVVPNYPNPQSPVNPVVEEPNSPSPNSPVNTFVDLPDFTIPQSPVNLPPARPDSPTLPELEGDTPQIREDDLGDLLDQFPTNLPTTPGFYQVPRVPNRDNIRLNLENIERSGDVNGSDSDSDTEGTLTPRDSTKTTPETDNNPILSNDTLGTGSGSSTTLTGGTPENLVSYKANQQDPETPVPNNPLDEISDDSDLETPDYPWSNWDYF